MPRRIDCFATLGLWLCLLVGFAQTVGPAQADDATLERVGAHFNSIRTFAADFTQSTPAGEIGRGDVVLQRPGRLHMRYEKPAPIRVIADGSQIAVANGVDPVVPRPLSGTPISLLLAEDVATALKASGATAERDGDRIRVSVKRRDESGPILVTLIMDADPLLVRQYVVTDAQGVSNVIAVTNVRQNQAVDPSLFVIPAE